MASLVKYIDVVWENNDAVKNNPESGKMIRKLLFLQTAESIK
jgi:hypothetical protein